MHEVFIARQPIFGRALELYAYELLFRHADTAQATFIDGDRATSQVILNAFTEIGLDDLVGSRPVFLNFTRGHLLDRNRPTLPRDRVVLEVLEGVGPDEELLSALRALKADGYRIALDDFVYDEALLPLVELADIVKVETSVLSPAELERHVRLLKPYGVRLLAEKLETQEQFERCLALGFDLFQGYFLSRPRTIRRRTLPLHRMPAMRLLAALHDEDTDAAKLERLLSEDVSLSYKLLRYLNSAFFPVHHRVESIRQAVVYLGLEELRRWAAMLALAAVEGKPHELMVTVLVRAKMCEAMAELLGMKGKTRCFMVGLFSGLDALLDAPLDEILASLNLSEEMTAAVLRHEGAEGRLADCALSYERGDWERLRDQGVEAEVAIGAYLAAVRWSDGLLADRRLTDRKAGGPPSARQ